jgi:3-methyladenine DNA glycosylase AlkD
MSETSMSETIEKVRQSLQDTKKDPQNLKGRSLNTPAVRKVAKEGFAGVKTLPKAELFELCERLLDSGNWEQRTIAFEWAFRIRRQFTAQNFTRFESWLAKYVDGWGSCDDFCTHAFGDLIFKFPEHIPRVKTWTKSENRWFRRGAAVVMIYGIRREQRFGDCFEIADQLLMDGDDLVQKGYGWMLKEISKHDPQTVFEFVMWRKDRMPRIALRYAIEKMQPELRRQAMKK